MTRLIIILLIAVGVFTSCKKEVQSENNKEYNFLVTHELNMITGWIGDRYILDKLYEKVSFKPDGSYEIIYKSPGRLHFVSSEYYSDTVKGIYSFDQDLKKITFLGKDSLVYLPGQLDNIPNGGTIYILKADWYLKNLKGDTLQIEGIAPLTHGYEMDIWGGTFYLEPIK